jgi:8-oxo-dGTP pyrophosphatase MutT (NUDIX family)
LARSRHASGAPVRRAFSAGGILLRDTAQGTEVLLGRRRRERVGATWSLPKGTPDGDETPEQTALREVREETGLEVRIVGSIGDIRYRFTRDGQRIDKTVHYYLMEATGGDLADHDREFDEVRWFGVAEAQAIMSFATERDVVARALPVPGPAVSSQPTLAVVAPGGSASGASATGA